MSQKGGPNRKRFSWEDQLRSLLFISTRNHCEELLFAKWDLIDNHPRQDLITDETSRKILVCARMENELVSYIRSPNDMLYCEIQELVTTFHSTAAENFHQGSDAHHKTNPGEASLDGFGKADFCRGREFMQALMFGPERDF